MEQANEIRLHAWIETLQSQGKCAFSLQQLESGWRSGAPVAAKSALNRLTKKGKIVSIYKGYYLIISPQYASKGILPPALFLDGLMHFLERPYYLGLLNAAGYHGASHQQPQEFFVVTTFPVLRPTLKKGLKLSYISIKQIPASLLDVRKTESGYLKISNPALTACDLVQFEKRVGGLSRAATVLSELAEVIKPDAFNAALFEHIPVSVLQRLGYLLEEVCENQALADALYEKLQSSNAKLYRIPLKASGRLKGFLSANRWKVVVNTKIEIDE